MGHSGSRRTVGGGGIEPDLDDPALFFWFSNSSGNEGHPAVFLHYLVRWLAILLIWRIEILWNLHLIVLSICVRSNNTY